MSDVFISKQIVTALATGETFNTLFPQVTPPVMVCSLAGAALYVLSRKNYDLWKQGIFAVISFLGGVYSAGMSSEIMSGVLNSILQRLDPAITVIVPPPLGALFASALCVSTLLKTMSHVKSQSLHL